MLTKAAATVRALSNISCDFEQGEVRDSQGLNGLRLEQLRRLSGSGGRYREESIPSGPLYLFDGTYRWAYNPDRNEYTRATGVPAIAPNLREFTLASYRVRSARILRQENVELATGPVVCRVIEALADRGDATQVYSPLTDWIDAARNLILKMDYTITFKSPEGPSPSTTRVTEFSRKRRSACPLRRRCSGLPRRTAQFTGVPAVKAKTDTLDRLDGVAYSPQISPNVNSGLARSERRNLRTV